MLGGETMNPPRLPSIEIQYAPTRPHLPSSSWPETSRNFTGPSESVSGAVTGSRIAASGEDFQVVSFMSGSISMVSLPLAAQSNPPDRRIAPGESR